VRLAGGTEEHAGRVEIQHLGVWGTICDHSWSTLDAYVVCRQLGYRGGVAVTDLSYGEGRGLVWLENVRCIGSELRLENCDSDPWGVHDCEHSQDAGVRCTPYKPPE